MDTLRVLVTWKCNLKCHYCCNEIPEIRAEIEEVDLFDLEVSKYKFICITGGEPLLRPEKIDAICKRTTADQTVILYTNGFMLGVVPVNPRIQYINVGLHRSPEASAILIKEILSLGLAQKIRFHAQDIHRDKYTELFPKGDVEFKFWHLNDCELSNEKRVVLKES